MATEERPWVSVVVASPRSEDLAIACVRSILPEARLTHAPVVVARAVGAAEISRRLGDAGVPIVPVDAGVAATLPEIRGAGLLAVQTQYAALVEDHCLAAPGWLSALCAAAPTADVVGGRMGNARRARATDWAAYFADTASSAGRPTAEARRSSRQPTSCMVRGPGRRRPNGPPRAFGRMSSIPGWRRPAAICESRPRLRCVRTCPTASSSSAATALCTATTTRGYGSANSPRAGAGFACCPRLFSPSCSVGESPLTWRQPIGGRLSERCR